MEKLFVAAAVLKNTDNQILIVQRPLGKPLGGYWEFPGGKIEPDEEPDQALKRELKEELGIEVNAKDLKFLTTFVHQSSEKHITFYFYVLGKWQGAITLLEGQLGLRWIDPSQISQFPMPEPNVNIQKLLPGVF